LIEGQINTSIRIHGGNASMERSEMESQIDAYLEDLRQEIQGNPKDIRSHIKLGWALYAKGQYEEALKALDIARSRFPDDLEVLYPLGLILKKLGKKEEALKVFRSVIEKSKDLEDQTRGAMLRRLAVGHANIIETGEWNLEKEIWERK
jgi:tetratricopeptide (TPR) repeat protein